MVAKKLAFRPEGGCGSDAPRTGSAAVEGGTVHSFLKQLDRRVLYNVPIYPLEDVHPDAPVLVLLDRYAGTLGFCHGFQLRKMWDDLRVARIKGGSIPPGANWTRLQCPDDAYIFIKFLSPDVRLAGGESPNQESIKKTNIMSTAAPAPAKKAPPKKSTSAGVKPTSVTPAPSTSTTTSSTYPWLRNRLKSAIVAEAKEADRKALRLELKELDAKAAIKLAQKKGVLDEDPAKVVSFLCKVIEAGVTDSK